uniref:Uncharacterized protein n=1 Tax=Daucus carota subsp. sativus TaxID=79200 RepID=A0A162B917_DAUCS|nr:PREDICTED: myb-related protein Myb4-like [Daucus carota subsp. sativus]
MAAAFKKCPWTPEEDMQLVTYIRRYGIWNWSQMPKHAARLPGRTDNEIKNRWHSHLKKRIANNVVEVTEPKIEQIDSTTDTLMTCEYPNDFVAPELPKLEEIYEDDPIPSYASNNIGASSISNNNIAPPAYVSSADPHISFWREPYSLEDVYGIDQCATYVDPEFGMPRAEDWFGEPFYPYYEVLY